MARLCEFPGLIVPQAGVWGQGPQRTLSRSDQRKSSQGAKRYLTVRLSHSSVLFERSIRQKTGNQSSSKRWLPVFFAVKTLVHSNSQIKFGSSNKGARFSIASKHTAFVNLTSPSEKQSFANKSIA